MVRESLCRDRVFDFAWQQAKTGMEALTISADGAFWWDIRRLGEGPIETLPLVENGASAAYAVSKWQSPIRFDNTYTMRSPSAVRSCPGGVSSSAASEVSGTFLTVLISAAISRAGGGVLDQDLMHRALRLIAPMKATSLLEDRD